MKKFLIKECKLEDVEKIKYISEKTFYETFSNETSKEDMEIYLKDNFSYHKLEEEVKNKSSRFYIVEDKGKVVAYMKLNFDKAQTEPGHDNALEVQRIYVLKGYKGKKIGKSLMEKAIEVGKTNNFDYVWLGVWEYNFKAMRFYEKLGFKKFDSHIFILGKEVQTDYLMRLML